MNPFILENLTHVLRGKKIVLGISGSIAAFKACDLIRFLRSCEAEVRVAPTEGALNFVTPITLETLSGHPILSGLWPEQAHQFPSSQVPSSQVSPFRSASAPLGTHHIDTARWADLFLIAPATAHLIGKIAHGLADDLLTTEILAFRGPIVIAPAMNPAMFENPAVQSNLELLRSRGFTIAGPAAGLTACGEEGPGRMIEPPELLEIVSEKFHRSPQGESVLITLGPTRSSLDPVRYLTNRSSGTMGAALAWAAAQQGYSVSIVAGPVEIQFPRSARIHPAETAKQMLQKTMELWPSHQIFIGAAAVLDWDVVGYSNHKIKKTNQAPSFELIENPSILEQVAKHKQSGQFVLGFAAETEQVQTNATLKLQQRGCDAIFANDVSQTDSGFESPDNSGWWIDPHKQIEFPPMRKTQLARNLLALLNEKTRRTAKPLPVPFNSAYDHLA